MQMVAESSSIVCSGTRKDGQPCRAISTRDGLCLAHSPALAEKRRAAYSLGGRNRARHVRLAKLAPPRLLPLYDTLDGAIGDVREGRLDPRQAHAMAALSGAMLRIFLAGETEDRLRKLEQRAHEIESRDG